MMTIEQAKKNARKGWMLNPNEKIVNGIVKGINKNDGLCPCVNDSEDKHCPCSNYREKDKCCCKLYLYKPQMIMSCCMDVWESNHFEPIFKNLGAWKQVSANNFFFEKLDDDTVVKMIGEMRDFVDKYNEDVRPAVGKAWADERILAIFYLAIKKQTWLIQNWPYGSEDLKTVFKCMNISDDVLDGLH